MAVVRMMRMRVRAADRHRDVLGVRPGSSRPRRSRTRERALETPPSPPIPSARRFTEAAW
jgi:hypothetical protein